MLTLAETAGTTNKLIESAALEGFMKTGTKRAREEEEKEEGAVVGIGRKRVKIRREEDVFR